MKKFGASVRWGRVLGMCAFALGLACSGGATTVIAPEFSELVNESDYVVRAVVKSVRSEFASPGSKTIVTYVELDVKEVIAGKPPSPLVLRMLGGTVGDKRMVVSGAPEFVTGDEDILFISGNGRVFNPLTALMHGRYPVARDKVTGRGYVMRNNRAPLTDTAQVNEGMDHARERAEAQGGRRAIDLSEAMSPEEFAAKIRAARRPDPRRPDER